MNGSLNMIRLALLPEHALPGVCLQPDFNPGKVVLVPVSGFSPSPKVWDVLRLLAVRSTSPIL